jgi:hypothetical protein
LGHHSYEHTSHSKSSNSNSRSNGVAGFPFIQASVQLSKLTLELLGLDAVIREVVNSNSINIQVINTNSTSNKPDAKEEEQVCARELRAVYASQVMNDAYIYQLCKCLP